MEIYKILTERHDGDGFEQWTFSKEDAIKKAKLEREHMSDYDNARCDVFVIGYNITCESWNGSADELAKALHDEEFSVPEYDLEYGDFTDNCHCFCGKIELADKIADMAIETVASWSENKQKEFMNHSQDYINDWYREEYCLTDDEISEIADIVVDFFAEEE